MIFVKFENFFDYLIIFFDATFLITFGLMYIFICLTSVNLIDISQICYCNFEFFFTIH